MAELIEIFLSPRRDLPDTSQFRVIEDATLQEEADRVRQGVGAAGDGRVVELDHHLAHLPGPGELGEGEPPRYVLPLKVGGTGLILNRRMKRPWPIARGLRED